METEEGQKLHLGSSGGEAALSVSHTRIPDFSSVRVYPAPSSYPASARGLD